MGELSDVKLLAVRVFAGPTAWLDAEVARSVLSANGIPCILPGEVSAGMLPVLDVPLLVREDQAARAKEILATWFDSPSDIPVE